MAVTIAVTRYAAGAVTCALELGRSPAELALAVELLAGSGTARPGDHVETTAVVRRVAGELTVTCSGDVWLASFRSADDDVDDPAVARRCVPRSAAVTALREFATTGRLVGAGWPAPV